jgi:IS30 family transposase
MNTSTYRRLSGCEREEISRGLATGETQASIARRLNHNPGTISREISRNSGKSGYRAFSAGQRAKRAAAARHKGKQLLFENERLRAYILAGLKQRWSPREIVKRIKMEYLYEYGYAHFP